MGQTKQKYLDWLAQQSKCKFCGDAAEDCECSRGQAMFTKGVWEYTEELGAHFSMIGADRTVICGLPNPLGADDCSNSPEELKEMGIDKELEEMRANAHLICSAPDLYEAVLIARSLVNTKLFFHPDDKLAQWEKEVIDKAIAKAEGK
jgi:hypothetical protein